MATADHEMGSTNKATSQEPTTLATILVNTVMENCSQYTNWTYNRAVLVRKRQQMIGHPSTRTVIKIVDKNLFTNFPSQVMIYGQPKISLGPMWGPSRARQPSDPQLTWMRNMFPSHWTFNSSTTMSPLEVTS